MESLLIQETDVTPFVNFNFRDGLFEIKGVSYPEYSKEFYDPLIESLRDYVRQPYSTSTSMAFKFTYFNTGTNPQITAILKELEKLNELENHQVVVKWYFEEYDEDMKELGVYFSSLTELPLEFVACEELV